MLDECKGEKFEDVVSVFALTVLRKAAQARNEPQLELACSRFLSRQQEAQLLPLVIAYQCSLRQLVSQSRKVKEHAQVYSELLSQRRISVENRCANLSRLPTLEAGGGEDAGDNQKISYLGMNDDRWTEILVSGPKRSVDQFLETPFEQGWKATQDGLFSGIKYNTNLLDDLSTRIADQGTRLRKWKTFAESLRNTQARRQDTPSAQAWPEIPNSPVLQFDRHHSLHLSDEPLPPPSANQSFSITPSHNTLLESLKADLAIIPRRNTAKRSGARGEQLVDPGELSRNFQAGPILPVFAPTSHACHEANPAGDTSNEDTSARLLQLKSTARQKVVIVPPGIAEPFPPESLPRPSQKRDTGQSSDTYVVACSADPPTLSGEQTSFDASIHPQGEGQIQKEPYQHWMTQSSSITTDGDSSAVSSRYDEHEPEGKSELSTSGWPVNSSESQRALTLTGRKGERSTARTATLLERTRQSMSLVPSSIDKARLRASEKGTSSQLVRLSQVFPVNQFDPPGKARQSGASQLEMIPTQSGSSTPRDELFLDAAAYDSVFKSRPRIAMGPAMSPGRSGLELDNMSEEDDEDVMLDPGV